MNTISNTSNGDNILTNLNKMICLCSSKTDFHELESEFYNSISSIIPAHATALYLFKLTKEKPIYISSKGVDNDFIRYYEKKGREVDPLRNWIMKKKSPNQSQLLLGLTGWRSHPVYNIVKTASIDFAMQAPIINGENIIGTINFGREYSEGPFKEQDLQTISILSHFLGLAIINSLGKQNINDYNEKFCHSVHNIKQGIIIADNDFKISYVNNSAKGIIIKNFGNNVSSQRISDLVKTACNKDEKLVEKSNNSLNLDIRLCHIPGTGKRQRIVFIDDNPPPKVSGTVKSILTTREIEVLLLVERGMQNKQIANELGVSVNTIKRHLDNMFGKFNVNSRTKLISKFYYLNSCS